MPVFVLQIKCDLENIDYLCPQVNNTWIFDIGSTDDFEKREGVTISRADVLELDGSKGTANYVMKWKGAKNQAYMKIIDQKGLTERYTNADSGKWKTILALECRGLIPLAWTPSIDFHVHSVGGTKFEAVDLSSREWADYDEENDISVSILELEGRVQPS
jgi:hypothetical protein